jgi:hypothetical protein
LRLPCRLAIEAPKCANRSYAQNFLTTRRSLQGLPYSRFARNEVFKKANPEMYGQKGRSIMLNAPPEPSQPRNWKELYVAARRMFASRKLVETKTRIIVPREQIEDADRFLDDLRRRYQTAVQSIQDDEQVAAFYQSGQVLVRVSAIQMLPAQSILMLTGTDESGNHLVMSSYYKSTNVDFRKIKRGELETPSTVQFSLWAA